ncbi:TRIC cation channel family protein [Aliivibrio kagoshimensis]|jgi:uncharacterized membrane protein YeiH|uniref:TRIC cation channel family protein n=1 Tax=Aliivibrio kagoshimensis TaxID=2910230 RepID=UPI003D12EA9C
MIIYFLDLFGTAIFAISGVILAGRLKMDPFGVVVLASVTAIGGGTIRDMALGATPVFWANDPAYLWVIFITCICTILLVRRPKRLPWYVLPVSDAIGLSVFVGIGVTKALNYGATPMVAVVMGVLTGCGGGIIRDILAREVPMILRSEIYATACIVGGMIHTSLLLFGLDNVSATLCGLAATLSIRLAAIRWHLSLPTFNLNK